MKLFRPKNKTTGKPRTLIIDGDIFAFNAVTNREHITEVTTPTGEAYFMLDTRQAKASFASRIKELLALLHARDFVIVFGGKGNFRKKVLPTYKANRSPYKPLGYWAFVDWIHEEYNTTSVDGLEADDTMGILHSGEDLKNGCETVMVSNDKDMRQIPGLLYDHTKTDTRPVVITREEAFRWSMVQAIAGDMTDGYEGLKGYGPVSAGKVVDKAIEDFGYSEGRVFLGAIVPLYESKGLSRIAALQQMQVSRICQRGDIEVLSDGSWKHNLWGAHLFRQRMKMGKKSLNNK